MKPHRLTILSMLALVTLIAAHPGCEKNGFLLTSDCGSR